MSELVLIEIQNGVADVRLNRADKHNALSRPMFEAITEAGEKLAKEKTVRAVVLSGNGPSFCSGLDVAGASFNPATLKDTMTAKIGPANYFQRPAWVWRELPVPVIAAVHGACFGGGLQIALGADIRIARPDARLSVMEIRLGLIPDMSGTATLRELVRNDVARELTYTGKIVDGTEAARIGLVTRTSDDPLADAQKLAREIAGYNPHAVRSAKRVLDANWLAPVGDVLKLEADEQIKLIASPNQMEALMARMQKREPKFKDIE